MRPLGRRGAIALGVLLALLYVVAALASLPGPVRGDESYHYAQIELFRSGELRVLDQYLTTIPGYHAMVAALLALFAQESLGAARLVNAGFGLLVAAAFFRLRRRLWPGSEVLATAQLLALPILAPYFFLVYTDVLALALLLCATLATLKGRNGLSALLLCGLVLVRQNEVVWALLMVALAASPEHAGGGFRGWRARGLAAWGEFLAIAWPYALPLLLFVAFWAWNGSISLSRAQAGLHPDASLHLGNPLFALFLAGLLLPLQSACGLGAARSWLRQHAWRWLLPLGLFALCWFGFRADNPYNTALPDFLPRNAFLLALDNHLPLRAGFCALVVLAACGLAPTRLRPASAVMLYPIGALFLAASWLIEQRYALVPLVLWLAFREQRNRAFEWATLALWLALAILVLSGMIAGWFFP